jgi:hypothetical protein
MLLAMALMGAAEAEATAPRPSGVVIEVVAGPYERRNTPVAFAPAWTGPVKLTQLDDGREVETQPLPGSPPRVVWMLREHLRLGVGDRPVLQYNAAMVESPEGIEPYFRRSGQIHPLFTPSGVIVSDDFPPDHAHQHAVFFAWVNTTFEGRHLDFWNQKEQTGRIEHVATLETLGGPVFGQFQVKLRHDDLTAPGGPKPVLDEVWTVRAYDASDVFLVDFESRQACAGPEPLTINKYHYGGMGIRGNRAWFDPTVKGNNPPDPAKSGQSDFLTSEGKDRGNGNHTRPNWVDLSGRIGEVDGDDDRDRSGGIVLLDHPSNFRSPQPVRLHPNKPYFSFSPMVLGPFDIAPGQPYVSHYRFAIHDGKPDKKAIERLWHDYAEPPGVRVVSEP